MVTTWVHAERFRRSDHSSGMSLWCLWNCSCRAYPEREMILDSSQIRDLWWLSIGSGKEMVLKTRVRWSTLMYKFSPWILFHPLDKTCIERLKSIMFGAGRQSCCRAIWHLRCHSPNIGHCYIHDFNSENEKTCGKVHRAKRQSNIFNVVFEAREMLQT